MKLQIFVITIMLLSVPGAFAFSFEDLSFSGVFESFLSIFKKNENTEEKIDNVEETNNPKINENTEEKIDNVEKTNNPKINENEKKKPVQNNNANNKPKNPTNNEKKKPVEKSIKLADIKYTEKDLKVAINDNPQAQEYIKGFGYKCLYIETDKETKFTLYFDTEKGEMKSMALKKDCDKEIYMEESIIKDLNENGFQAKKIGTYLKKTKIPTGMYFKAMKVMVS